MYKTPYWTVSFRFRKHEQNNFLYEYKLVYSVSSTCGFHSMRISSGIPVFSRQKLQQYPSLRSRENVSDVPEKNSIEEDSLRMNGPTARWFVFHYLRELRWENRRDENMCKSADALRRRNGQSRARTSTHAHPDRCFIIHNLISDKSLIQKIIRIEIVYLTSLLYNSIKTVRLFLPLLLLAYVHATPSTHPGRIMRIHFVCSYFSLSLSLSPPCLKSGGKWLKITIGRD